MPSIKLLSDTINWGQTLDFHPVRLDSELLLCYRPHLLIRLPQVIKHQASSSSPRKLESLLLFIRNLVSFSVSDFTMDCKTCLMVAIDNRASQRFLWNQMVRKPWMRLTESHLIQQPLCMRWLTLRPVEYAGCRRSLLELDTLARSKRAVIKKIFVFAREEP
jgi:hypothetical protein